MQAMKIVQIIPVSRKIFAVYKDENNTLHGLRADDVVAFSLVENTTTGEQHVEAMVLDETGFLNSALDETLLGFDYDG